MKNPLRNDIHVGNEPDERQTTWAKELCSKFRDALGGVHLGVIEPHANIGHLAIARGRGQLLGCMVTKPGLASDMRVFPIIAAAVPTDIQRLHVGLGLLERITTLHGLDGRRILQACCRADLPSNLFWFEAGFRACFVRTTNAARGKPIIVWRRRVDGGHEGCDVYHAPRKPRGGGGRWVPNLKPEMAEVVNAEPPAVLAALARAGLTRQERQSLPTAVAPQSTLFPPPARSALTNGR